MEKECISFSITFPIDKGCFSRWLFKILRTSSSVILLERQLHGPLQREAKEPNWIPYKLGSRVCPALYWGKESGSVLSCVLKAVRSADLLHHLHFVQHGTAETQPAPKSCGASLGISHLVPSAHIHYCCPGPGCHHAPPGSYKCIFTVVAASRVAPQATFILLPRGSYNTLKPLLSQLHAAFRVKSKFPNSSYRGIL